MGIGTSLRLAYATVRHPVLRLNAGTARVSDRVFLLASRIKIVPGSKHAPGFAERVRLSWGIWNSLTKSDVSALKIKMAEALLAAEAAYKARSVGPICVKHFDITRGLIKTALFDRVIHVRISAFYLGQVKVSLSEPFSVRINNGWSNWLDALPPDTSF